jgi:NAD(P)H-dependent FMN reductase
LAPRDGRGTGTRGAPMPLQFAILYGSVREARQGIRAARFVEDQLRLRGHATFLVDAKECALPLLDRMYTLKEARARGVPY